MIKKKVNVTVHEGRSVTTFFKRAMENFERKFDGFPATLLSPSATPAVQEGAIPEFSEEEIVDAIANTIPTGFVPPCPDIEVTPCSDEGECVVEDTFNRVGASFGDTDSGHTWENPLGITPTRTSTTDGTEGLLHPEPGFAGADITGGTVHRGAKSIDLEDETALALPITATFKFRYTGIWSSMWEYNRVPAIFSNPNDRYWAPGFADIETRTGNGEGDFWNRAFLAIRITAGVPHHRFHVYNADGSLWVAHYDASSTAAVQYLPTQLGAQLDEDEFLNVKMYIDSDRAYLRLWKDGDEEPTFWHDETDADGQTWSDPMFDIISTGSARDMNQPPFDLYIEDLCISNTPDCPETASGSTVIGSLSRIDDHFAPSTSVRYYTDVWYDDIIAVKDIDYTVDEDKNVVPISTISGDITVRARWVT